MNFSPSFAVGETLGELLGYPSVALTRYGVVKYDTNGDGTGGRWLYGPESMEPDNGVTVRKPDDKLSSQPGRWFKYL